MHNSVDVGYATHGELQAWSINIEGFVITDSFESSWTSARYDISTTVRNASIATRLCRSSIASISVVSLALLLAMNTSTNEYIRWIWNAEVGRNAALPEDIAACIERALIKISPASNV